MNVEPEVKVEDSSAPPEGVVEPVKPIEGEPAIEVVATPEEALKEPPKKRVDDDGNPSPEHPRWKQLYRQAKDTERELTETKNTMNELRDLNKELRGSVDTIMEREYHGRRPDVVDDPEGYASWIQEGAVEAQKKVQREAPKPVKQPQNKLDMQIDMMIDVYPDYNEITALAEEAMKSDPILHDEIFGGDNPPLAAYRHGQKIQTAKANRRGDILDAGYVEGGTPPPVTPSKLKITATELEAAKRYGLSAEEYLASKAITEKARRGQ